MISYDKLSFNVVIGKIAARGGFVSQPKKVLTFLKVKFGCFGEKIRKSFRRMPE